MNPEQLVALQRFVELIIVDPEFIGRCDETFDKLCLEGYADVEVAGTVVRISYLEPGATHPRG